jgi:alpha-glucosidase
VLYQAALRLRRQHPALGAGGMRWLDSPASVLSFAREPGFVFIANLGTEPVALPEYREILLVSEPLTGDLLPPDAAAWLSA